MKEFWDERFAIEEYAYGTFPNVFFKKWIDKLPPANLLLPGEGEGRNAVYAARKGWDVDAFDQSDNARMKALKLAEKAGVSINYFVGNLDEYNLAESKYDFIALIFLHLGPDERRNYHKKLIGLLKPGGLILIESFSKGQIQYNTGGPKNIHMLYSMEELSEDLEGLKILEKQSLELELEEGLYHKGKAHLSRIVGMKK